MKDLYQKATPHPIREVIKKYGLSLYGVSLRIEKSYSVTAMIVNGYTKPNPEVEQKLQDIIEEVSGE